MAIHKSVLKRQRQADKQQIINKSARSLLKTLAKKVEQAVEAKNADVAKVAMVQAMKAFDSAASKGILHKNTASRKISRLSIKVRKISAA